MSIRRAAVTALVVVGGLAALASAALGQAPGGSGGTSPAAHSSQNAGDEQYRDPFASITPPKQRARSRRRSRSKRTAQSERERRSERQTSERASQAEPVDDASPQPAEDDAAARRKAALTASARAAAAERAARRKAKRRAARRLRQRARRAASRADTAGKTDTASKPDAHRASAGPPAAIRPQDSDGGSLRTPLLAGAGLASLALLVLLSSRLHRVRRRS